MGVRPGDWSPLNLSGDPTPGDPDVLLSVASYMDVMAGHAQTADDGLAAVLRQSGDGAFVGKTADWLREQISKEMSGFITGVRTAFSAAGPTIRTYAEALRDAQAKADQALRDAAGAGEDEERINALKADAENAAADVRTAAGTARQSILDATSHIKSPVTPKSACEVFWEIFTWLTLIITVVAIFVGGPLGLIAFAMNAALAVKATLDFAMGKTNALGLALGLLGLLGPSTRPLIALGDLTKLATGAWRNITQLSRNSFNLARTGINDFWRAVSTLSLSGAMRGIGDIGVTLLNSVKVGALMIPRIVGPMDGLAARGFVTLEKFTVVTVPSAITRLGSIGHQNLVKLAGLTADAGRFVAANAVRFGNLMVREFGGWKWLRIFTPLAGHEIGAIGVSGAFKLGVLGRGLAMGGFDGLAALGGGVRLANGITTVHVVKPGGAPPPAGGINFSPSGLYLPDLIEKPLIGAPSMQEFSFSARSVDLSAARGALDTHDLAGLRGVQNLDVPMPTTAGTVSPVTGMNQVTMPTVPTPGAVTLPNMQIGNLSTMLNRAAGGVEGLADFGRAELRNLHMGEVSAVRVSETAVAFDLGAPEKAFGGTAVPTPTLNPTAMPTLNPTSMPTLNPTSAASISQVAPTNIVRVDTVGTAPLHLGKAADATTVHQALNLLDGPDTAALTALHRLDPPTSVAPTGLGRDLSMTAPPRLDQVGGASPQQLSHLHALEQLKQAQHALANVSGDALAVARAEKDVRVTEALVRKTTDGLKIEAREIPLAVDPPPAHLTGPVAPDLAAAKPAPALDLAAAKPDLTDFPAVPTHQPGTNTAELEGRLAALRGTDVPSPAARQLELEHRLNQLRPGGAAEPRPVDPAMFPDVPTISPAEATARATAVERLTDLETQLVAARAEEDPAGVGSTRLDDAGSPATPQVDTPGRPQTPDQVGTPGRADGANGTDTGDGQLDLPSVPRTDPAATPGPEALSHRLTELISDARGVDLPEPELRVLSTEVRTAIEQGRHGDAARGLNTLHDRIDRQALFQRLDSYRAHVDAGHHRAAQLGMDKSTWLQHAIDIERATAAGHTDELHRLLDAYENSLAGKLAEQKLHDQVVPDAAPGRALDEAGSTGDLDELQARLDALRGDHTPDPQLAGLELELRFANLRGADGPDVPLPQFPDPPTLPPGSVDDLQKRLDALRGDSTPDPDLAGLELRHRLDALRGTDLDTPPVKLEDLPDVPTMPPGALDDLTDRLADLRAHREDMIGMPPAERAEWNAEFARAGDETADADVLARYETRITALEREARLAELRDGTGPLSAAEYRTWQDALVRAGDSQAGIDHVLSRYAARLDEHRLDSAAQINAALTSPDHLRPLDSRLEEALGALSPGLRDSTATRYTTLGDRLAQLRGADAATGSGRAADDLATPGARAGDQTVVHRLDQLPSPPRDLPTARPDDTGPAPTGPVPKGPAPTGPARANPPAADIPTGPKSAETPTVQKPHETARPTPAAGDEVLELPAPQHLADDVSTAPAEKLATPPRDLLGDGRPAGPARVIEVDAERWTPFKDAFRFEPTTGGQPPKVTRPPASGERVGVGYQLTVTDQDMHFALKLHLDAAPGVTARDIAEVKARTVEGLQRYVNASQQHLPGWDLPMRVTVDFVDDPTKARGSITVVPAGTQMSQQTWATGASPAKYAHEIVHNLGAKDSETPPNALLRDTHQPEHGDLMGSHPHDVEEFVLTPRALSQIAAVLSPYFSDSTAPRPVPEALTGNVAEEFWHSGVDVPPRVTAAETTVPAPPAAVSTSSGTAPAPLATVAVATTTPKITVTAPGESIQLTVLEPTTRIDNPLPGLYKTRPDLLYTPDTIDDLDSLVRGLDQSVADAVRARVAEKLPMVPGLSKLSVQTDEIGQALRDDKTSFFTTGGRSFDVRDGLFGWHRVTVTPVWAPADARVIDQSADRAKFDTRSDQAAGTKHASTTGGSGSIGAGTMFPQRVGYGAGGAVEIALSRPLESFEDGAKLTDSHNVRSGSGSHLVTAPVGFEVVVTDPTTPFTGPKAAERHVGEPVGADVTFRSVDDIAKAIPREPDWLTVDPSKHTSMLVENFTPVRILRAGIGLTEGTDPTGTWNDVIENTLVLLQPTKAVGPGTLGAGQARGLFKESSLIGNLMPALDTAVHPPTITSTHGAHALSLELTASVPKLSILADVAKTSFRWQPGQSEATKLSHSSRVGTGLSLVPARWAFGPGYVQARLFGGFLRSMNASITQGGTSRTGTEFKDIPNVLVEAHFRVTINAGLREVPGSRLLGNGTVEPITVDLVVLGHLPAVRAAQLLSDSSVLIPSPTQWYVPPYALGGGGRSVMYGLSGFQQLYLDVTGLIRQIEGGFLPEFGKSGKVKRMTTSRAAIERQANQDALDQVMSMPGLRQGKGALLKTGLIAKLSRTKKIGTRHIIVHVTASYTKAFQHLGINKGDAVRTTHADAFQEKISAGSQWRGAVAFEGGGVFRLTGNTAGAFVPGGAVELRGRFDRQSGTQLGGQESRLNGGTPDSQTFGNDLQITVQVYAYKKRLGPDPKSRVKFGRVMHQRLPRPATDSTRVVNPTHEPAALVNGKKFTRFRLVETRPVTVQFDNASVLAEPISMPTTMMPRPDPLAVDRRTQLQPAELRDWVDAGPKSAVNRWLSVEDFPGSASILALAKDALHAAQHYTNTESTDTESHTKLGGLRGTDGLAEGMPVWANLIDRLGESRQIHGLASMLEGLWQVDRLTSAEDGAATDLAIAAALTNPTVLPAHANITNESASVGSVEISAAKTVEKQLALRANFSANVRKVGTSKDNTHGGGAVFPATYEKVLYSGSKRDTKSISGAIERNANNRKGRQRSFLVAFDMRVSAAVEITNDPDRYAVIPQSLRSGEWLHHHKSVARHGTITNAIFLRLSAATMVKLGLLPKLAGDPGTISQPWLPTMPPLLTLPPGRSLGLGLYAFDETPTLTESMTTMLRSEAAKLGPEKGRVRGLLDMVQGEITNRSIGKISESLSGPGLDDPMLNRSRLLYLFTPEGQAQHWPAMVDGGVSVLHMKPGRMTQHSRDVRLIAEPIGEPTVLGFVADHEDLDIKTTHTSELGVTTQRMHGSTATLGVAGTGVSNHNGENLAAGVGDTVGRVSQVLNAQSDGSTAIDTNLSSGRGVKAKLETRVKYTLAIFDKGVRVDDDLLVVHDTVVQDRWADDLRPPRTKSPNTPTPYRVVPPEKLPPGWQTLNGLPLPPRFSAEDLSQAAQVQRLVENLLTDAAKRLQTKGYAGAHQIHQSLTPEILLPAMSKLMSAQGVDLPPAVSAQIFGQKATISIRLLPESASLGGVSSGVFREHAPQQSGGYSTGTSLVTQNLRIPRIPLLGRGFADDPYQALEAGGPGIAAGDTQSAAESGSTATGGLGNVKPESRSAAIDYLSRVEVTVSLSYSARPTRTVTSSSQPAELVNVSLRMGLHDARTALHIPKDAVEAANDSPGRVKAFDEIADNEATLATLAAGFVAAADNLDQARYDAYALPEGSSARIAKESQLPGLHQEWNRAGQAWWELLQRHHQMLDDFRHRYIGVSKSASDADATDLARHAQNLGSAEGPASPTDAALPISPQTELTTPQRSNTTPSTPPAPNTVKPPQRAKTISTTGKPATTTAPPPKPATTTTPPPKPATTTTPPPKPATTTTPPPKPATTTTPPPKPATTTTPPPKPATTTTPPPKPATTTTPPPKPATTTTPPPKPATTTTPPPKPATTTTPPPKPATTTTPPPKPATTTTPPPKPATTTTPPPKPATTTTPPPKPATTTTPPPKPATTTTPPPKPATTTTPPPKPATTTTPPPKPATTTSAAARPPQVLPTTPDGYCQLYSTIGSAPELVSARLASAGLGSPALHAWLGSPEAVRAQITAWAAHADRLVPPTSQLGQAAELLRRLVQQHLQTVGADGVPEAALVWYRNNRVLQLRAEVDVMNRDTLLGRLRDAGITRLRDPGLLSAKRMRDLYLEQRTADLVTAGLDRATARAHAESQVRLKPATHGSTPRDLADEALSMRAMFDYLTASGNPVGLQALSDEALRDQLMAYLLDPLRPADASEFSALTEAVRRWKVQWQNPVGEAFAGLLAAALDARVRIHTVEHIQTIGRPDAPLVEVYRGSDHYQAMVNQQPSPVESAPGESPPPAMPTTAELDHAFGPAVNPKGAKTFEIDPPRPAGGKNIKREALQTQQMRVNPAWMPLKDFAQEIHAGRTDANWHYVVTESGDIVIGSEEILTAISAKQLDDLHTAMRAKNPDLTPDQLKSSINQQGHPTIAVRFDVNGRAYADKGRISGELHRDPATGEWTVNDKSGRYMSEKIRPGLDPADVKRWLDNVATKLSEHFNEPVHPRPFKHTTAPAPAIRTAPPPEPPPPAPPATQVAPPPPAATQATLTRPADTTAAPPDDLRTRWMEFKAQRLQAEGTDPVAAKILADGLTADRDTMLADLARQHVQPTTAAPAPATQTIPTEPTDTTVAPPAPKAETAPTPAVAEAAPPPALPAEIVALRDFLTGAETEALPAATSDSAGAIGATPHVPADTVSQSIVPSKAVASRPAVEHPTTVSDGPHRTGGTTTTVPEPSVGARVEQDAQRDAQPPAKPPETDGGGIAQSRAAGDPGGDPTLAGTQDSAGTAPASRQESGTEPTLTLRGGGSAGPLSTLMSRLSEHWTPGARSGMFSASDAVHFYEEARRVGWTSAGDDRVVQVMHRLGRQTHLRSAEDKAREFVWHVVTTGTRVQPDVVIDGSHLYEAQVHGHTVQVRANVEEDSAGRVVRIVRAQPPSPLDTQVATLVEDRWTVVASDSGTSVDPDAQLVHLDPTDVAVHSTLRDIHEIATDSLGAPHLAYTNRALGAQELVAEVPRLVEQDNRRLLDDDFGNVLDAWRRLDRRMSWLLQTPRPRGYERLGQMPVGHHAIASFNRRRWQLQLRYDLDADRSRDALVHEKFHSTQDATQARWRVAETGNPSVLAELIDDPQVHRELLEGPGSRLDAAQREVAELLSRHGLDHPDRSAIYELLAQRSSLMDRIRRWLAAAEAGQPGGRLRERVQRAVDQVETFGATGRALYLSLLHEAQAFLLGLWIQEAGSVHRWGAAAAQLPPTDGYDSIPLATPDRYPHMPAGAAGVFLRPSSSTTAAPSRLPRRDGMLVVVQVADADQAGRALRRLRTDVPAGTTVELLTAAPLTAARAVELAGELGGDRMLALDVDLVEPTGALADHFVAYSRDHRLSLGPGARYYTVHSGPQQPVLDLDSVSLRGIGSGLYQLVPGWHAQAVGQRVWIGPADMAPAVRDDDPPVVIGLPSQQTPWAVWVLGTWIGRALASHVGTTTESGFVRVHRPEPRPAVLSVAIDNLLHPVSDVERRTVTAAFDAETVVDEVGYAPADPANPDLGFTGHDLVAGLLDVAGAAAAEQNPSALVAALDGPAGWLATGSPATAGVGERTARHNLLAAGYLAARAYGVFELTPQRLDAAYRVLAAHHDDGRLPAGETALTQLLRSVNSDWSGDVDPARLQRLLELVADAGRDKDDLVDIVELDDMWLSIWLRDLSPLDHGAGVWSMGGAAVDRVMSAADELVVVYRAGTDLLPIPPAGSPAHSWIPTGPALLAQLGTALRQHIGEYRGHWDGIRLIPVVDEAVDADLADRLTEGVAALHGRRVDRIILGEPVEPPVDIPEA
ncbi:hypothetical protein EDC02_5204 [Micromonospora sp. Llam0]|uniref:hypothetical protein n=1 Tax=Micromonospora sp. Llam0 TaxID=2485143 RepID=UPI000F45F79F|nr:hypothetical protein [Micromonospora sp. Llam0]ROO63184.1 hypothetical protein EDC02_5204 [Micromonospora sp. Llam0]